MIKAGLAIIFLAWLPLLVAGALDPSANPVGLGLLAWAGSLLGLVVAASGLIRLLVRLASRNASRP